MKNNQLIFHGYMLLGDCIDEHTMPPGQPLELTPVAIQTGQLLARRIFGSSQIKVRILVK